MTKLLEKAEETHVYDLVLMNLLPRQVFNNLEPHVHKG